MNDILIKEAIKLLDLSRVEQEKEARELVERALNFLKASLDNDRVFREVHSTLFGSL